MEKEKLKKMQNSRKEGFYWKDFYLDCRSAQFKSTGQVNLHPPCKVEPPL